MLEQFYRNCRAGLIGWCTAMTQDPVLGEDLVQEAFLRAMDHLTVLENLSETQQKAWFYRTMKNLYLDRVRRGRFETVYEDFPETIQKMPEYDGIDWGILLSRLPGNEGIFFCMRYLEGYTSREIGEIFHMPPGTVRAQLSLARKHLKEALKPL